ncbi:MAG: hypothetical protein ACRDN6_00285 [Gaiellaceae bacterium]
MSSEQYVCIECGRAAPPLASVEILEWEGGDLAMAGEWDPLTLSLLCPACMTADRPEDEELGGES